jgi:Carboxypeptidase regulatory-like domain
MKGKATKFLTTMLAIGLTAGQAMSATVCGVVENAQGQPVSGCPVTVKDASGAVLGQTTSGSDGGYQISNLGQGTLDLFIDPCAGGTQGGSGVLDMTGDSRKVDWQVSNASSAVASQGGVCRAGGLTAAEWASIGVLALAAGGGIAAIVWAETGNRSDKKPVSPQF